MLNSRKNERRSKSRQNELRRGDVNLIKNSKEGIYLINKELKTHDCALISTDMKKDMELSIKALGENYSEYIIKLLEPNQKIIHLIIDINDEKTLKKNLLNWKSIYNQNLVSFLSQDGKAFEISTKEKEIPNYKKIKTCEKQISKILKTKDKLENYKITKTSKPENIMGKRYLNSLLKNL